MPQLHFVRFEIPLFSWLHAQGQVALVVFGVNIPWKQAFSVRIAAINRNIRWKKEGNIEWMFEWMKERMMELDSRLLCNVRRASRLENGFSACQSLGFFFNRLGFKDCFYTQIIQWKITSAKPFFNCPCRLSIKNVSVKFHSNIWVILLA